MMYITTINQRSQNVMPKQFHVILNNNTSSRHELLVIDLQKLHSFLVRFTKLLAQYGQGLSTFQNRRQHSWILIEFDMLEGCWSLTSASYSFFKEQ